MISHALNSDNDIFMQSGQVVTTQDGAEVVQHVRTRLQFFKGEWLLDTDAGTPWYQEIFERPANVGLVEARLKARILQTPGVDSLTSFTLNLDKVTRTLSISFEARTTYGEIVSDEVYLNV
jgi:hypothetical protein